MTYHNEQVVSPTDKKIQVDNKTTQQLRMKSLISMEECGILH